MAAKKLGLRLCNRSLFIFSDCSWTTPLTVAGHRRLPADHRLKKGLEKSQQKHCTSFPLSPPSFDFPCSSDFLDVCFYTHTHTHTHDHQAIANYFKRNNIEHHKENVHTATSNNMTTAIHDKAMMREAAADTQEGISAGGHMINAVRYADDKAVVSNSQQGLQKSMINVNKVTKAFGMKINVKKT